VTLLPNSKVDLEQIHHVVFVVDAWRVQAGIDFSPLCLSFVAT
jgi:hypothetical protein